MINPLFLKEHRCSRASDGGIRTAIMDALIKRRIPGHFLYVEDNVFILTARLTSAIGSDSLSQ